MIESVDGEGRDAMLDGILPAGRSWTSLWGDLQFEVRCVPGEGR